MDGKISGSLFLEMPGSFKLPLLRGREAIEAALFFPLLEQFWVL
jgi:hypothetical protein